MGDPTQGCVGMLCPRGGARLPGHLGLLTRPGIRGGGAAPTYLFLLDEPHKGRPLDLHRLALPVVEGQDEVEEVGFPQIGRRLLLKVSPGQTHPAAAKDAELDGSAGPGPATPCHPSHTRGPSDTHLLCPQNAQWAPYTPPRAPWAPVATGQESSRVSCPPRRRRGVKKFILDCARELKCSKHLLRPDARCVGREESGGGGGEPAFTE